MAFTNTTGAEPLLTSREAAGVLRVSEITLRRMRKAGTGPVWRRIGRGVRYRRADLDAFVSEALGR